MAFPFPPMSEQEQQALKLLSVEMKAPPAPRPVHRGAGAGRRPRTMHDLTERLLGSRLSATEASNQLIISSPRLNTASNQTPIRSQRNSRSPMTPQQAWSIMKETNQMVKQFAFVKNQMHKMNEIMEGGSTELAERAKRKEEEMMTRRAEHEAEAKHKDWQKRQKAL